MVLSQDKSQLLQSFLGSLPEQVATRLAKAIEFDRLMDGAALPHDMILDALRPALRRGERYRTPGPLRLFCRPFEDLLTADQRRQKQKGSIARESVLPMWEWLSQTVMPGAVASYVAEIKPLVVSGAADAVNARAAAFWSLAAQEIRSALPDDAARKKLGKALKNDLMVADFEEMALLLAAGAEVATIQAKLPKPVPAMSEELLWSLRENYDHLLKNNADAAPYVAVIAMNRLARPWEALKLPLSISRTTQDTLISQTDMGLVGEILFNRLDTLQQAILATRHPIFDTAILLEMLSNFTALSSGIVKEIEVRRDGDWGQRLIKDRQAVGSVMDGLMDRAPKEIAAAMPMQKGGAFGGGPKAPDFTKAVEPDKLERAMRYAKLIVGSRKVAAAASFASKQKNAVEEAASHLQRYTEDAVKEMRTAQGAARPIVEAQFAFTVEMTALLFSDEEAELLRRRGRAAQATQAA